MRASPSSSSLTILFAHSHTPSESPSPSESFYALIFCVSVSRLSLEKRFRRPLIGLGGMRPSLRILGTGTRIESSRGPLVQESMYILAVASSFECNQCHCQGSQKKERIEGQVQEARRVTCALGSRKLARQAASPESTTPAIVCY